MSAFAYRQGVLAAEDVALDGLALRVGTPFYCYARRALEERYRAYAEGCAKAGLDALVAYGIKANDSLAVIATLARAGAGADVVSEGEIRRALRAGVAAERIVFSGVGKTQAEIAFALATGIRQINVESEAELAAVVDVAGATGRRAPVALRVNPNVDAGTHDKIATGRKGDKFGVALDDAEALYARMAADARLDVRGLAVHIGSQILSLDPFRTAFTRVADAARRLRAAGHPVATFDFGGGLGVGYRGETAPTPAAYAAVIADAIAGLDVAVIVEPGRSIVAEAGVLVTRVIYVKRTHGHTFVIVDAAMNDLLRPVMYDAYHDIRPVREPVAGAPRSPVEIVGPICESADAFARARPLPPVEPGHVLVIENAGAYGRVMASCYNARPLIPEVLVHGNRADIIRRRPTFEESIALESIPGWLACAAAQGAA
ncbi:MAG: diaminopimelate decarboxylase [Alphaproteobacteria bacterium]